MALFLVWAGLRAFGLDGFFPGVQLFAFTPYVALAAVVGAPLLWLRRRHPQAVALALVAASLAGAVVPRVVPDADRLAGATGPTLRVATANLLAGGADAGAVVDAVRDRSVDVLVVQELTAEWLAEADRAGLGTLLPRRFAAPRPNTQGSAILTRHQLSEAGTRENLPGWFQQAYGVVSVAGGVPVLVESVHAASPYSGRVVPDWRETLRHEPPAGAVPGVLAGDFNATLDHGLLRELIGTGYRDAADVVGAGLLGTWPYDGDPVPPVTLDHVLADRRIGVRSVAVYGIQGTDHRMVVAELVLPGS